MILEYRFFDRDRECWVLVIFTRASWPIQEKDDIRVIAQPTANEIQNIKTTSETMAISPISGRFTVFCPQLHLLFKMNKSENNTVQDRAENA